MTQEELIKFIKRILERGSEEKSACALRQLREILINQRADSEMVRLVKDTLRSFPEVKDAAEMSSFSEDSLRIAIRRAEDRRRREEEIRDAGRC